VLDDQQAELRTSHVIDLQDGVDAARAQWTSSARREVGRARRGDVRVREAQTFSDWAAYFASYVRTMNLWKSPTSSYDLSLFRLLWEARSPSVRLWLAEQKSLVIGGALVFTHGNSAVWWHAAQAPRVSGTANLLQWEILAVLDADGIGTYDLSSSGGHQGVVAFKESLGAAAVSFRYLVRRHPVERVMGFAKQSANRARSW
jgi:hypothetical protein